MCEFDSWHIYLHGVFGGAVSTSLYSSVFIHVMIAPPPPPPCRSHFFFLMLWTPHQVGNSITKSRV